MRVLFQSGIGVNDLAECAERLENPETWHFYEYIFQPHDSHNK